MRAQIESGELVEDSVANELVRARLLRKDATEGFILDGYPATANQAVYLDALLKERGLSPVVINLTVSDDVARKRMQQRRRADDKPASIEARQAEYHHEAHATLDHFQGHVITIERYVH